MNGTVRAVLAAASCAALLGACAGASESDVVTKNATTVGAATHEMRGIEFVELDPPRLAVAFDDGSDATAAASPAILEGVGLGLDVLSGAGERVTWGGIYLIYQDSDPDVVVLEETESGEWEAVSVEP